MTGATIEADDQEEMEGAMQVARLLVQSVNPTTIVAIRRLVEEIDSETVETRH
jgi:hypothetical protein